MLKRVVISITDECNLKCKHCYNEDNRVRVEEKLEYINYEFIKDLKELGVEQIGLTGGEPLTNWNVLNKLLKLFKENGFNVLITTNGLLLDRDKLDELKSNGVDIIQVSIDGATKEKHEFIRGKNTYDKVINIFKNGLHDIYNIVPMYTINKTNYMEIEKYINIMNNYNVKQIGFERYIPVCGKYREELELDSNILEKAYELLYRYENRGIIIHINDPLYNIFKIKRLDKNENFIVKELSKWDVGCSALRTSIYIDAQGNVLPCTFSNRTIFNANDTRIKIIENHLVNKKLIESKRCSKCKYGVICRGCRAAAKYSKNKDWCGDDPLCFIS